MAKREAMRAIARALREVTIAAQKDAKKNEKSGKSKAFIPPLPLTEASTTSPSQNPRKWDAPFAQLSTSRLQQMTSPILMDFARGALHVQEFFFSRSLLSTDAHFMQHKAFLKEWVDMKAFLKVVFFFFCYVIIHDGVAEVLQ